MVLLCGRRLFRSVSQLLILSAAVLGLSTTGYAQTSELRSATSANESAATTPNVRATPKPKTGPSPAVIAIKQRIASNPLNWNLYNEMGLIYYREGRYDEAVAAYQQAIAMNPISRTLEAERQQQETLGAQITSAKQVQSAQAIGAIFGAIGQGIGGLGGQALGAAGQLAQAGAVMSQYIPGGSIDSQIKAKNEVAQVYHNLGDAYMGKGDYDEAAKAYEQSLSLDPSRMSSLQSAGSAYLMQAEYDKATATLNRLLVLNPTDPPPIVFLWLSSAYKQQDMSREETATLQIALNRLRALASQNPKDAATLDSVADSYFEMAYYTEAAQTYEQSLGVQKDQPVVLRRLGISYYALGRYADAAKVLQQATSLMGDDSSAWLWLGRSVEKLGRAAEAEDAFNKAVGTVTDQDWESEPPPVPIAAASMVRNAANRATSIKWLEELALRYPTSAYRFFELGLAYERADRYEDALESLERSARLNPLDSLTKDALARVTQQLAGRAREDLDKANDAVAKQHPTEAIQHLTNALQRMPAGRARDDIFLKLLRIAANMPKPLPLTEDAERHFARGNAMLKSAASPVAVDRAIMEFRSTIRRSPWWTSAYLNLGLAYSQRRLYRDASLFFKLYLIANPNAENANAVRAQIYELEYKQEQDVRSPALLTRLRYGRDYGEVRDPSLRLEVSEKPQEGGEKK